VSPLEFLPLVVGATVLAAIFGTGLGLLVAVLVRKLRTPQPETSWREGRVRR
jgi:hypothetical protein